MRRTLGLFGSAILALSGTSAQADVVSDWAELVTAIDKAVSDPNGGFDEKLAQGPAKVELAMFEAANSVDRRYQSWLKLPVAANGASEVAAISTAAHDTLASIYPSQQDKIDKALSLAMIDVPAGPARDAGIAAGRAAAVAALAAGGRDPALANGVYRPTAPMGKWSASGVPFPPEIVTYRPWFMTSASQFRLPPPPDVTSAAFTSSFNETKAVGAKKSTVRTPEQTVNARFFVDYNIDPTMRQVASMPGRSLVRNARFYALTAMALDDFYVIMVDGKMAHMFWRPLNAIRTADADGNPATDIDPAWEPLLRTPSQPEYPCGHCSFSEVVATIAAAEGPPPPGGYRFVSDSIEGLSRNFASLQAYSDEASNSRIEGGVHWRMTADASRPPARAYAKLAMARFAPPLK